jgi:hypothetical protein
MGDDRFPVTRRRLAEDLAVRGEGGGRDGCDLDHNEPSGFL